MPVDECLEYDAALRDSGRCIASEALQPVHTATTVRVRNGRVSLIDGPFAETKEQLAGFYLIEAKDLNEPSSWRRRSRRRRWAASRCGADTSIRDMAAGRYHAMTTSISHLTTIKRNIPWSPTLSVL